MLKKFKKLIMLLVLSMMMIQLVGCSNKKAEDNLVKSSSTIIYNIFPLITKNEIKLINNNDKYEETIITSELLYNLSKKPLFEAKQEFIIEEFRDINEKVVKRIFTCKNIKDFTYTQEF